MSRRAWCPQSLREPTILKRLGRVQKVCHRAVSTVSTLTALADRNSQGIVFLALTWIAMFGTAFALGGDTILRQSCGRSQLAVSH